MGIEELNKKLHGRDLHFDRDHKPDAFDPEESLLNEGALSEFKKEESWIEPKAPPLPTAEELVLQVKKRKRRKTIAIVLGSLALLAILVGTFFKIRSMLFDEKSITASFSGPHEVASSELSTFTIEYSNNNWADLENASVVFTYPEAFRPVASDTLTVNTSRAEALIGTIPAKSAGKKVITGKFYASKGDKITIHASLQYSQKNVSSRYTKETEIVVSVARSALLLEIEAPSELATGQDIEYEIRYRNTGDLKFSNLNVKVNFPEGFHFVSADPKQSEGDNLWYIGDLPSQGEGKIVVRGNLQGARNEFKTIDGAIGFFRGDDTFVPYGVHERKTRIITSPLTISQTVNGGTDGTVSLGDTLAYSIIFRNEGNVGLRDAIVTIDIDSPLLDFSRLILPMNGAYDANNKMLFWKASEVPSLKSIAPGQGGKIEFKIPLFETLPENAKSEKDIAIKTLAKIDSPDIPTVLGANKIIGSNILYVPVNTNIDIQLLGYYNDTVIPNSGPIPPVAGKETTYTMHLDLNNTFSEVVNSKILMRLPTGVRYTNKSALESQNLKYNERTNELSWEIGTLSPTSKRAVVFQIAAVPNPNQAGNAMPLIHSVTFTGTNTFTKKEIRLEKNGKTTYIPEDTLLPSNSAQVEKAN